MGTILTRAPGTRASRRRRHTLDAMSEIPTARWCRSRRSGAVCTRPRGHAGLHNRVGTGQMWSDAQADPPACSGAGAGAMPAPTLDDGFPHGRALCADCWGFVALSADGTIAAHDAFRGADDEVEATRRAAWFNAFGWQRG